MSRPAGREQRWQQRLAGPVLLAALASVPAVFLTLLGGVPGQVGTVVNWVSGAVLVAEPAVLLAVSDRRTRWLRRHFWLLVLTGVVVVGVALSIGPVQLLRLLRVFGALRLVRVGRIIKAARLLRERTNLTSRRSRALTALAGVLAAVFVAVVLADPTSRSRSVLESALGVALAGPVAVVTTLVAGALLAGATVVVVRARRDGSG